MLRILLLFFFTFSLYAKDLDLKALCSLEEDFELYNKYSSDGRTVKAEEILKSINKKLNSLIKKDMTIKTNNDFIFVVNNDVIRVECPNETSYTINLVLENSFLNKETQKEFEDIKENGKFEVEAIVKIFVESFSILEKEKIGKSFEIWNVFNTIRIPVKIKKLIIPPGSRKE